LKESFSIKGLKDKAKEKRQSRLETIRPFLEKIGIGSGDSGTVNNTQNVSVNTQSIDSSSTKGLGNMLSNLFNSKNKLGY